MFIEAYALDCCALSPRHALGFLVCVNNFSRLDTGALRDIAVGAHTGGQLELKSREAHEHQAFD